MAADKPRPLLQNSLTVTAKIGQHFSDFGGHKFLLDFFLEDGTKL